MDREIPQWRVRTMAVAYMDLMVTSVLIPFYIVLVVINKDTGAFYTWFPVWVALILAFVVLKLYAAIKLRNAVDIGRDLKESLRLSRLWIWMKVLRLVISTGIFSFCIYEFYETIAVPVAVAFYYLFYAGAMIIVIKFRNEVHQLIEKRDITMETAPITADA